MVNNKGSTVVLGCLRLCMTYLLLLRWTFPQVINAIAILFHSMEFSCIFSRIDRKQTCKPAKLMYDFPIVWLLRLAEYLLKFRRFQNANLQSSCITFSSE